MSVTDALATLATAVVPPPPGFRIGGRILAYDGLTVDCAGLAVQVGAVCALGRGDRDESLKQAGRHFDLVTWALYWPYTGLKGLIRPYRAL